MKSLLTIGLLALALSALGQPIIRNEATTNSTPLAGGTHAILPANSGQQYLLSHVSGTTTIYVIPLPPGDGWFLTYSNNIPLWTRNIGNGTGQVASVTQITVNNISNFTDIQFDTNVIFNQSFTIKGQATFNNFIVTTGGVQFAEVAWAGPTNSLPLNNQRQYYSSPSATSVTGFTGKSTTNVQPVTLEIKNTSATNWVFNYPPGVADLNYVASYTVTNGTVLIWSMEYDPYLGRTNALGRISP